MIALLGNAEVAIRGFELDGCLDQLILGGPCGDVGRQCAATDPFAYGNHRLSVSDLQTHRHGPDVRCERNARQPLSWVGGIGVCAEASSLSSNGRGRFMSPPGAGLDIEAEESVCRGGRFVNCRFVDNAGRGCGGRRLQCL